MNDPSYSTIMAETEAIAKMAEFVSREIFSVFGWERKSHENLNFECEFAEHRKKTHPVDVVYHYASPLDPNRIYLNVDLKSYARASISSSAIVTAANSLILAVDCANRSKQWRDRYVGSEESYDVHGLLFVYNHDGEFDQNWSRLLADAKINNRRINATLRQRLYIVGPPDILYLVSVADDIKRQRGDNRLPARNECWFHYPDLTEARFNRNQSLAATMEILTAPWMIFGFRGTTEAGMVQGSYCYYRGNGDRHEEFCFLIDYLFRTQLVGENNIITIKPFLPTGKVAENFNKAKEVYASDHHALPEFQKRLDRIQLEPLSRIRQSFNEEDLGMD